MTRAAPPADPAVRRIAIAGSNGTGRHTANGFAAFLVLPRFSAIAAGFDGTWKANRLWKLATPEQQLLVNGSYICIAGCYVKQAIPADGAGHAVSSSADLDTDAVNVVKDHTVRFAPKKQA